MSIKTYSIPVKHITFEREENEQLMRVKFYCISEGENRNESSFSLESMIHCKDTSDYAFKPILGAWEKNKLTEEGVGGLGGHNSQMAIDRETGDRYITYLGENGERGLGVLIPNTAQIEPYKGKQWLTVEGYIWGVYNPEVVRLLKRKRASNVSVEIEVIESLIGEDKIEKIYLFSLLGITIIGVEAGIENASVLLDFAKTSQYNEFVKVFSRVLSKEEEKKEDCLISLSYALDKDNASNDEWGSLSKTKMRERLLEDKFFESYVPKLYLIVPSNWKEDPKNLLRYPIYQIKDNKVVLNINAINKAYMLISKEKEKKYYNTTMYKFDMLKKRLGDCLSFGLEKNKDGDNIIIKEQPKIIQMEGKMKIKELQASLLALFQKQEESTQEVIRLSSEKETKVGVMEFADDEEKTALSAEIETLSQQIQQLELAVEGCKEELLSKAKELAEAEEEPVEEPEEGEEDVDVWDYVEEEPKEDEGIFSNLLQGQEPFTLLSVTKNYIAYLKDNDVYVVGYKKEEVKAEGEEDPSIVYSLTEGEPIKTEKLFTRFNTGGTLSKEDALPHPMCVVEISTTHASIMGKTIEAQNKVTEYEAKIAEFELKHSELQSEIEKYKQETLSLVSFFEEKTKKEKIKESFRKEILEKIFSGEYQTVEDLETKINSHLYSNNKSNYLQIGLSGGKNDNIQTDEAKMKEMIESYRNKQ